MKHDVSLNDAIEQAKIAATRHNTTFGVWFHVGCYGRRQGDIQARHTYLIRGLSKLDPHDAYALIACIEPEDDCLG